MTTVKNKHTQHSFFTRLFHMALASVIILQLLTSLWMITPKKDRQEDWLFEVHEVSGLIALFFAFAFWLTVVLRQQGTQPGIMFPWFSATRRQVLWGDLQSHWHDIKTRKLPAHQTENPLASAVHGLGLLLMTAMATTGSLYFIALELGLTQNTWAKLDIEIHELLSSFVWIYLIAHAGVAVIYHYAKELSLSEMWSLRK